MATRRLTQKWVDSRRPGEHGGLYRDTEVKGLMLRVGKTASTWKLQRDLRGQTIKLTLGPVEAVSLASARLRAMELVAMMRRGVDPRAPTGSASDAAALTLEAAWHDYLHVLERRERSPRTIQGVRANLRYLDDWRDLPLGDLKKSMCRERHDRVSRENGPYTANGVMRSLRAVWNWAAKSDDADALGTNPTLGVVWNREEARDTVVEPGDLPGWWAATGRLPNPLRVTLQRLGLLSGLRPGTLAALERDWVDLDARAVKIPSARMKSGREFHLPLSGPMVGLVESACRIGDTLYNGAPFLFPTRSNDGQRVIATAVWRERSLPGQTGHTLRHTYRTMAHAAGVSETDGRLLMDQSVPGISGVYIQERGLFAHLLECQERVSARILEMAEAD